MNFLQSKSWFVCFSTILLLTAIPLTGAAQTFSTTASGTFPRLTIATFPNSITVDGLPDKLDGISIGVTEVSLTLTTDEYDRLEIFLVSPDGTLIQLADGTKDGTVGGAGTDVITNGTFVFRMDNTLTPIRRWVSTATPLPAYLPDVSLNAANNSQNPNGTWKLYGRSANLFSQKGSTISKWSITFGTTNIKPAEKNDNCVNAIKLRNFKTTGEIINSSNINYASHLSEIGVMGNCYSPPAKKYPVTTAWFTFVPLCSTDVVSIHTNGQPYTSVVTGNCNNSYSVKECKKSSVNGTVEYTNFTPGISYYAIVEGENSIADYFDIKWVPGACPKSPVGMIDFDGFFNSENMSLDIFWKTAWEQDNDNFEVIYKKSTWNEFISAGTVKAINSPTGSDYALSIPIDDEGVYYFQIIQKDKDSTTEVFGPLAIDAFTQKDEFLKSVNTRLGTEVWYYSSQEEDNVLILTSLTGAVLFEESRTMIKGLNKIKIPDMASGIYIMHFMNPRYYKSVKLLQE